MPSAKTLAGPTRMLPRDLLGSRGVQHVAPLLDLADGDVRIDAQNLRRIDAMCAVVLRAAVERFVERRADNRAWIRRPEEPAARARLTRLVGPLPHDAHFHGPDDSRSPTPEILLEGCRIRDHEDRRAASERLRRAVQRYGGRRAVRRQALLLEALNELVDNGLRHGRTSDVDVICAACVSPASRLQVAVVDTGDATASHPGVEDELRRQVTRSRSRRSGFFGLAESASYPSTLRVLAGHAHLRWDSTVRLLAEDRRLAGYLAVLEVH